MTKKYYVIFDKNQPEEFNDLDEAVAYYGDLYKAAKSLVLKDSDGIILGKKLED